MSNAELDKAHTLIPSLAAHVDMPDEGVLSKPVFTDPHIRVTLFAMSQGEELSEHATTMEALLQFIEGEADITLGADAYRVGPGAWVRMKPGLAHSIRALQPLRMLLVVLRDTKPEHTTG